jgi:glutathione synthase/RimK-type ligase-like ATP-grasp enzyme
LKDKLFTYLVLQQLRIQIPKGTYFLLGDHQYADSADHIVESLKYLKYPLITKPNDSSLGKGITVLTGFNVERIRKAVSKVKQYSDILLVQDYLSGQEYRVIAVDGEVAIAFEKHDAPAPPREISLPENSVFRDIISRSMKQLGATVCGYDFMVENGSVKVLEINSNPFIFRVERYLSDSTVEQYFLKLENLLRRNYGHRE